MSWTQSKGSCWILKTNLDTFFCCFWQKCVNFHLFCWKICKYPLRSFKNSLLSFKIQWDPSNSNGSYWIWFGPISDPIGSNRILSFKIRPDQTQWKIGPNWIRSEPKKFKISRSMQHYIIADRRDASASKKDTSCTWLKKFLTWTPDGRKWFSGAEEAEVMGRGEEENSDWVISNYHLL